MPGHLAWGFAGRAQGRCDIGSREGRGLQGHGWLVQTDKCPKYQVHNRF